MHIAASILRFFCTAFSVVLHCFLSASWQERRAKPRGYFQKKYPMSMDWYHNTARWYWSVDTLLWQLSKYFLLITKLMCNIRLQAPKPSGKCKIKHCLPLWCGWMVGLSVYGHVIFLWWIDFLSYVAPLVHVELCLYLLFCVTFSECFVQSPSKTWQETFFLAWSKDQSCSLRKIEGNPVLWTCKIGCPTWDLYEKAKIF